MAAAAAWAAAAAAAWLPPVTMEAMAEAVEGSIEDAMPLSLLLATAMLT